MKRSLFFFALLNLIISCNAQPEKNLLSQDVIEMLKKDKFNLNIFELSFCLNEIYYILENDSSYYKFFAERIEKAFALNQNRDILYIHSLEYELFINMMIDDPSLKKEYPDIDMKMQQLKPAVSFKPNSSFSEIFKNYIKYPEQVDDICIIMLVCKIDCNAFDAVMNDKLSLFEYSNWLEYGFEEFRYYPGTLNKGKGVINNRIIDYILKTKNCQENTLAYKSFLMIKKTKEKY